MSASPAAAPMAQRRKQPVSIFAPKKKQAPKRQAVPPPIQQSNGAPSAPSGQQPLVNEANSNRPPDDSGTWTQYPIKVSKDTLMRGLHYHAMKFQGGTYKNGEKQYTNPYDPTQFTRPLHLHRRLARDKMAQAEQPDAAPGVDDKERELINIKREERQREKEINQAQIAPTGGGDTKKPARQKPKKKVEDVWQNDQDERHAKKKKLRYDESRQWHLEDFEGKNVWVGNYEEPPSEESVMFEISGAGFRMVPVEKWYRFTQSNRTNVLDSDVVEKEMAKTHKVPRWMLKTQVSNDEARRQLAEKQRAEKRALERGGDEDEGPAFKDEYNADVDEIDFGYDDEFQDDDEGMLWGEDTEEAKDTEKRVREEMRNAGLGATGIKDEDKDYDEEEAKELEREREERRKQKKLRKALLKRERKNEYDDDFEHGEFSESSDTEDSEEERERLEQERKQEEVRKANGEKSGTSTKGSNTPSGRSEKRDGAKVNPSLKRPGSPDLSEMSGNESSRKRAKVNGTSAPKGTRALSPDTAHSSRPPRSQTGASASGSETESTNRDSSRQKIRLKNSPPQSPNGSRAGTPSGSRPQQRPPFPTLEEVRAAIPVGGIVIGELVNLFRARVAGRQSEFIPLVKTAGRQDPVTKKIMPKTQAEMLQQQQGQGA